MALLHESELASTRPAARCERETGPTAAGRVSTGLRAILFRSTSARHRIRHGIRHTAARAWRSFRRCIANDRLRHMLIGYARVSKADGSQSLDLQRDALQAAGVDAVHVYHDFASGVRDDRRDSTAACARSGRATCSSSGSSTAPRSHPRPPGQHRAGPVGSRRGPAGAHRARRADRHHHGGRPRLVFGIFAALAEFERELIDLNYHPVIGGLVIEPSPPRIPPAQLRLINE